jgi:hypothetical protein
MYVCIRLKFRRIDALTSPYNDHVPWTIPADVTRQDQGPDPEELPEDVAQHRRDAVYLRAACHAGHPLLPGHRPGPHRT